MKEDPKGGQEVIGETTKAIVDELMPKSNAKGEKPNILTPGTPLRDIVACSPKYCNRRDAPNS